MICEQGARSATVARIVARAGVSRRTFYEIFRDAEECVLVTMQDALARARSRVLPVWCGEGEWRVRLRRGVVALLLLFDEDPVLARLLVVESLGAGERILELRAEVLDALVDAVEQGQAHGAGKAASGRVSAEGALGGALAIVHARLMRRDDPGRLVELAGALVSVLVLPYYGRAAAQRELVRALPEPPAPSAAANGQDAAGGGVLGSDPFKDAGMRMTYRTMRVLGVIAEHPGSSNRRVGDLSEIGDQGQVSKLLSRLERVGMIANGGGEPNRGEPNAWVITSAGRRVIAAVGLGSEQGLSVNVSPITGGTK